MRASDPYALITPGKIYRALGKSAECGGCIRLFVEHVRSDAQMAVPAQLGFQAQTLEIFEIL